MRNFLPQIFNLLALQAFKATEEPDGLQVPEQWVVMIEALPLLSDRYYFHLFQLHERCLEMTLCSVARVLLYKMAYEVHSDNRPDKNLPNAGCLEPRRDN